MDAAIKSGIDPTMRQAFKTAVDRLQEIIDEDTSGFNAQSMQRHESMRYKDVLPLASELVGLLTRAMELQLKTGFFSGKKGSETRDLIEKVIKEAAGCDLTCDKSIRKLINTTATAWTGISVK